MLVNRVAVIGKYRYGYDVLLRQCQQYHDTLRKVYDEFSHVIDSCLP